ncbi:MAG: hypothetical protein GX616_11980, partial [Planctomycetes bacterium]|nr:hypothetical protein [Planctomycetota bacterium]
MSRYIALRRIQIIVAIMMVLGVFIGAPATQAAPNAQVGIIPTDSISCDDYTIVANSRYDAENNTTRFSYAVTTLADADHDLSHWDLSLETCVAEDDIVGASHDFKFGTDPTTDVSGIKFDIEVLKGDTVNFWFDLAGYWPETMATAAIKASNAFCFKETIGPSCQMPSFYGIAGQKWHDVNGNGSPDNGESFLPGWTIQLQHPTGAISTTVTGDFGYYAFSGLPAGAYTVTEVLQSGWYQTYPAGGKHVIVLPQDETGDGIASDKDFGNHQLGSLNVTKVVDWGEVTPDTGQTFEICVAGPSFSEPNCQIADYDGGTLAWTDLIPGQYTVTETNPGAEWTVAGSGVDVTVPAGGSGSVTVTNSIDQPVYGSILVRKVTVPSDDSTEFPFTFESDGFALKDGESELFGGLVVGTYDIAELVPEGWDLIGVQCVEVQPTLSDDLPTFVYNANGVAVTLGAGDHAMCTFTNTEHIDLPDYDLSGFKWHDENGNGVWDDGEPGLAGWEITLMSGDLVLKTTTAADGSYVFTNLPPGAYTVAETQQPGWTQTFPADKGGKHSVTIADADVTGKSFGNRVPETPLYNLSGFKWEDMDGDGAWDSGEPGLAGWTITLEDEAGATKTTITGAGGAYAFTGL